MRFSELRSRLRAQVGNPNTGDVDDTLLDRHNNDAYLSIANKFKFYKARKLCHFDTIQGERRYNLPSDVLVLYRLRDTTHDKILTRLGDRLMSERVGRTTEGLPTGYARYRQFVELDPTPSGIFEMEGYYKATLTAMTGDDESPAIPESWHLGIVLLAKYTFRDEEGDIPKAIAANQAYKDWLATQPSEVDEEKISIDSGIALPTLAKIRRTPNWWEEEML